MSSVSPLSEQGDPDLSLLEYVPRCSCTLPRPHRRGWDGVCGKCGGFTGRTCDEAKSMAKPRKKRKAKSGTSASDSTYPLAAMRDYSTFCVFTTQEQGLSKEDIELYDLLQDVFRMDREAG